MYPAGTVLMCPRSVVLNMRMRNSDNGNSRSQFSGYQQVSHGSRSD